jgi:hypothetical protein
MPENLEIDVDDELDLSGDPPPKDETATKSGKPAPKPKAKAGGGGGGGGRPTASEAELRRRIDEGLDELVSVVRDFLGSDNVAAAIEDDKKRMAEVLAAHAIKRARVATWVVRLFGKDSALAGARAFGPTMRTIASGLRARRVHRGEQTDDLEAWQDENGVWHSGPRPAS